MGLVETTGTPCSPGRHKVYAYTQEQLSHGVDALCGMRANWILFLETPTQHELDNAYKPFLLTASPEDMIRLQRGLPQRFYPVMYDKDMKRLCPSDEALAKNGWL